MISVIAVILFVNLINVFVAINVFRNFLFLWSA